MLFFFICCIAAPFVGRKLGWSLNRRVFYSTPSGVAVPLCLLWGIAVALGFRYVVLWLKPNIVLAVIGLAAGGYVSIPDYGIGEVWMAPYGSATRKDIVSNFPFLMYLLSSIVFYFAIK